MTSFLKILICTLLLLLSSAALSAEIDSVTSRKVALEDSLESLNAIINQRIEEGVANANKWKPNLGNLTKDDHCNEEVLYRELRKSIFASLTASWGLKGYSLDKQLRTLLSEKSYSLPLSESIYQDISYLEGFSLKLKELSDVVNINGNLVGLDKVGHFFSEGWSYFELTHLKDKTLLEAIQWGREQEEGKFGYTTTGIFSYADLVANFNGWRFWNKVLAEEDDPIAGLFANLFSSSYVGCGIRVVESIRSRKWVHAWSVKKKFNLVDFLDGAWDEGNNCVCYKDPDIETKVLARIKQIDQNFKCPITPKKCETAVKRYGEYAQFILHPACLSVKSGLGEAPSTSKVEQRQN